MRRKGIGINTLECVRKEVGEYEDVGFRVSINRSRALSIYHYFRQKMMRYSFEYRVLCVEWSFGVTCLCHCYAR